MAASRMTDDERRPRHLRALAGGLASPTANEDALLGAWLVGDDAAFGALVSMHQGLVLAIVRRYAATPQDARDLVQRTFLRAFESARRTLVRGRGNAAPFRRWLIRVAVNLARNHRRDAARWTTSPLDLPSLAAEGSSTPDALERAQSAARVRCAALRLPRRQREVLTLRIDAELPFAEIGEVLGITENAAKVSFHLAVKRLRSVLAREDP
jgi:RNA polymerase sigma-70 factor (ECF subfamily)